MKKGIKLAVLLLIIVGAIAVINHNQSGYTNISADELDSFMASNEEAIYIDVRTPEEFALNQIAGFINIDSEEAVATISENYEQDEQIVLICRSGSRSKQVADGLVANGYKNVYNVSNGIINY